MPTKVLLGKAYNWRIFKENLDAFKKCIYVFPNHFFWVVLVFSCLSIKSLPFVSEPFISSLFCFPLYLQSLAKCLACIIYTDMSLKWLNKSVNLQISFILRVLPQLFYPTYLFTSALVNSVALATLWLLLIPLLASGVIAMSFVICSLTCRMRIIISSIS